MQIKSEFELLDPKVRAQIIKEIQSPENKGRKDEYYKRYECNKDRTYRYVLAKMLQTFDRSTVEEMSYAVSNISFMRKIIEKLARVYANGVERTVVNEEGQEDEALTDQIEKLAKKLKANSKMKKTNRSYKRDKNTLLYIKPYKILEEDAFDVEWCPLFPYLYDVVENPEQREKPLCVILSHYEPPSMGDGFPIQTEQQAGFHGSNVLKLKPAGDGVDQKIADSPQDQNAQSREYIWWSNNYHFTTNEKGEMLSDDSENPIKELPFVNFAEDQDGAYWAQGGEDLVHGAVFLNSSITHMQHIGVVQGYGQFYMTGKNLPKGVKIGPSKGIRIEVETKDDPVPQLGFLSANPQLAELRNNVSQYVALLLTSNNLSVSNIATQLESGTDFPSGIAMILDKAESMEDVEDQRQIFHDNEPVIWQKTAKWINLFKSRKMASESLQEFELPEDLIVQLKFPDMKPIMSEKEKLENLEKRKELGLNTDEELMMMDNPQLTKEQAEEKLRKLIEDKLKKMQAMGLDNESDQGPGDKNADDQSNRPGPGGGPQE